MRARRAGGFGTSKEEREPSIFCGGVPLLGCAGEEMPRLPPRPMSPVSFSFGRHRYADL